MKIKKFECYEDPAKCVDSMLFDSGTTIAVLNYEDDEGHDINISLEVQGEVKVIYKGNTYVYPSEFPKELIWRIK